MSKYNNFTKPTTVQKLVHTISGDEAKRLYLEEVKLAEAAKSSSALSTGNNESKKRIKRRKESHDISDKELFSAVQNNDVNLVRQILVDHPDYVNKQDEFGWSLLMIACQANAADIVRELLFKGADTSIRDKAGNSARSLTIKNKNIQIADLLLSYKQNEEASEKHVSTIKKIRSNTDRDEEYYCDTCNKKYSNKHHHLSSTIHNINASKHKKITTCYKIPLSNKGFQIMLKGGWDKDSGLGADGSGIRYPIRTIQKHDRKGLGHDKPKKQMNEENKSNKKQPSHTATLKNNERNKQMEISFRREFY